MRNIICLVSLLLALSLHGRTALGQNYRIVSELNTRSNAEFRLLNGTASGITGPRSLLTTSQRVIRSQNTQQDPRFGADEFQCYSYDQCNNVAERLFGMRLQISGVHPEDLEALMYQATRDHENGFRDSYAYKTVEFLFSLDNLEAGGTQVFDALSEYHKAGGRFIMVGGVFLPTKPHELASRKLASGVGNLGVFALGVIPVSKLIGSLYKGVSLLSLQQKAHHVYRSTRDLDAVKLTVERDLVAMGEKELAAKLASQNGTAAIRATLASEAKNHLSKVGKWGALTGTAVLTGLMLPSHPKSLSPADLARFALSQGCILASGDIKNPTTKAIQWTGQQAQKGLEWMLASLTQNIDSTMTSQNLLSTSFLGCEECAQNAYSTQNLNLMTDQEVMSRIQIMMDEQGQILVTTL